MGLDEDLVTRINHPAQFRPGYVERALFQHNASGHLACTVCHVRHNGSVGKSVSPKRGTYQRVATLVVAQCRGNLLRRNLVRLRQHQVCEHKKRASRRRVRISDVARTHFGRKNVYQTSRRAKGRYCWKKQRKEMRYGEKREALRRRRCSNTI